MMSNDQFDKDAGSSTCVMNVTSVETPMMSSSFPPQVANPPSSYFDDESYALYGIDSDLLGLGDLRNGKLVMEDCRYEMGTDDEYYTDDE